MDIDKNQKIKNIFEKWTKKYKESINCSDPKGFSQRAHCQGKKKKLTEDLRRWFKEKWTAQDGSECGGYKGRGRVKCRPSKRVSSGTPQTWGEMSKKEKIKAVRLKQKAHKKGKQWSSHKTGKTWGGSGSKYQPTNEDYLIEKNIPTDPELWSRAKSLARSKFKVYPSAYANSWGAKWYKKHGGGWKKSMKENTEYISEDYLPLIEEAKKYLLETYTVEQIDNLSDEDLINEFFGGAGLLNKVAGNTELQQQLGGLAAAQAMKSKGAKQAFIGDVRASLRGESGVKGFLTRNIRGVENLRLKRREDALKALTASSDKTPAANTQIAGSGSFAAQQQRKTFGPMSVEKDLVRQAGADAIKQKAEKLLQQDSKNIKLASDIMNKKFNSGTKFSYGNDQNIVIPKSPTTQQRIDRIRQTGLGPKSLYQTPSGQESVLTRVIKNTVKANLSADQAEKNKRKLETSQDQETVISRLAARDADVDTSDPAVMFKPKRPFMSFGRRKPPSKNILKLIRKYVGESIINEVADKSSMKCNKPRPSTSAGKKMMVKACEDGKEKIVHFGAKGYGHNYSKAARKSFRARHKCDEPKSKLSAQYWACKKLWAGKGGSTAPCPEGRQCKESVQINNNIITEANMTPARKKLIKKMVKGIMRENPKYSESRAYAIATAQSTKTVKEALNNFKKMLSEKQLSEEIVNPDNVPMTKREQVVRDNIAKKRKLRKWCKPIKGKDNAKNAYHRCATFIVMKMRGGKKGAGSVANKTKGKTKKSKSKKSALDRAETEMKRRQRANVKRKAKRAAAREAKKGSKD